MPGLNDSHIHVIRGGLNYHLELRWDGVASLADALRMLKDQARSHAAAAVGARRREAGASSSSRSAACRLSQEINDAAPDTPVFVLHLYDRAWLNGAALRAVGYTRDTPDPPGAAIERDRHGNPTGLLIAKPNASILYATLAKGPRLSPEDQTNSTRHFMRELNRLGPDKHHRRGRWLPELSGRLRGHRRPAPGRPADAADRLQPVHAAAEAGAGGFPALDVDGDALPGRRVLSPERCRRDARVLGRRLRRLPGAAARSRAVDGSRISRRWFAISRSSGGRSGCTPPTTSRSRAFSTCSSASTVTSRSISCAGSSITRRRSARATSSA